MINITTNFPLSLLLPYLPSVVGHHTTPRMLRRKNRIAKSRRKQQGGGKCLCWLAMVMGIWCFFLAKTTEIQQHVVPSSSSSSASSDFLFSAGLVADIQYAPIPDGFSVGTGTPRYYRYALEVVRHAFAHFQRCGGDENTRSNNGSDNRKSSNTREKHNDHPVELVLNLGDIIDGKCREMAKHGGDTSVLALVSSTKDNEKRGKQRNETSITRMDPGHYAMDRVLEAFSAYTKGPILNTYGNHCLENFDRATLGERLGIPFVREPKAGMQQARDPSRDDESNNNRGATGGGDENDEDYELVGYYSYAHKGIRFVVLDTYDVSLMHRETSSPKRQQAETILREHNPNYGQKNGNLNSPEGMEGLGTRFLGFNGAVDRPQLEWLRSTLERARKAREKVVVVSHQTILPGSAPPENLIWNYDKVLEVLRAYSDVVVVSLAGHEHPGGYRRDPESGIHFRVMQAVLETKPPDHTYAIVDFYRDRLVVNGFGNCESASYDFDHTTTAATTTEKKAWSSV